MKRRATGRGSGVPDPTFVRRLGEAGYGPGDGQVGTLDLLARSGLPVPEGFVLTDEGHREFLRAGFHEPEAFDRGRRVVAGGSPGGVLEREIRTALLELGARTVVVGWASGARRGLGTIPAVMAAVREAWTAASVGAGSPTWPVLVQRQARPDYTGWTSTADLATGYAGRGGAPLHDVESVPGRGVENVAALTRRAAGVLGGTVRLGWGLEDGRWLLVSVSEEPGKR